MERYAIVPFRLRVNTQRLTITAARLTIILVHDVRPRVRHRDDRAPIGLAGAKPPTFSKVGQKVFTNMEIPILLVGINGK